jgi:hypothetical protein
MDGGAQATTSRHSNVFVVATEETLAALAFSSVTDKFVALATIIVMFVGRLLQNWRKGADFCDY